MIEKYLMAWWLCNIIMLMFWFDSGALILQLPSKARFRRAYLHQAFRLFRVRCSLFMSCGLEESSSRRMHFHWCLKNSRVRTCDPLVINSLTPRKQAIPFNFDICIYAYLFYKKLKKWSNTESFLIVSWISVLATEMKSFLRSKFPILELS